MASWGMHHMSHFLSPLQSPVELKLKIVGEEVDGARS